MRNKNLIIAFIISIIAALLIFAYLSSKEKEINASGTPNKVLVAAKFIPAGSALLPELLKTVEVPEAYIQPGALRRPEHSLGTIAVANIAEGEQILANKVTRIAENLSSIVPIGYRAAAINLDTASSVGDFIKPGDVVDVLCSFEDSNRASYTATIIQSVRVIAVNENFSSVAKKESGLFSSQAFSGNTVVLALEPSDSELFAFAENKGKLKLTLRNPGDDRMAMLKNTNFSNVLRNQQKDAAKPAPDVPFLEIIRGIEGEKVPLKK